MKRPARSPSQAAPPRRPTLQDYRSLSEFRHVLQRFLTFSQDAARRAGLAPRQHQALLAIKGFPADRDVTIHDLAERLCIQHNTAVELVDRLVEADLVARRPDVSDRRRILLDLTRSAEQVLHKLSAIHLDELQRLRPTLQQVLDQLAAETPPA